MGMITPLLHITLPEDDGEERHFAPIVLALEAMVAINTWHIRRANKRAEKGLGTPIPPLYASGVHYEEDKAGREDWRDCYTVLARGKGDCDNLVAWRVAELRAAGVDAEPVVKWQHIPREVALQLGYPAAMIPDGGLEMVHCLVRTKKPTQWSTESTDMGYIEDPSKLLGMGGNFTNQV